MTLREFTRRNGLRATDALVLRKRFIGMVDHYVLYMGHRADQPVFIANYKNGVKEISNEEIIEYLKTLEPVRIEKFNGTEQERKLAFNRALSRVGERAYNYFSNNCEHFKNWVHFGDKYSSQVDKAGNIGLGTGGALTLAGLTSKNSKVTLWGAGILLAGALLKGLSKDD
jgi:CRISPR/Cas system CMR-associated protein Cmr5 small subunit